MIKSFFRKPLYIILYTLLLVVGLFSLGKIDDNIKSDKEEYKYIYENTKIKGEVLQAKSLSNNQNLPYEDIYPLMFFDQIENIYTSSFAKGFLEEDRLDIYASSDISKFLKKHSINNTDIKLSKGEAIISEEISKIYDLNTNDDIDIRLDFDKLDGQDDVYVKFKIKDIVDFSNSDLAEKAIIINNDSYFDDSFLANETLKDEYGYYENFYFEIKPSYNNIYDEVKEKIDNILGDDYIAHTNSKDFYNVIRPLEDKINSQERLLSVLKVSLSILTSFVFILMLREEKINILIRKMYGESNKNILLSYILSLGLIILAINTITYLIVSSISNVDNRYVISNICLNLLVFIISLIIVTSIKVFNLYQNMED